MSENKKIRASVGYTIGNYLIKGLSFITIPIFSRILSQSDYGIYNTFSAYESFLCIILGVAIHSSYKNARYKYGIKKEGHFKENFETYASNTIILIIINSIIWFLILSIFGEKISQLLAIDKSLLPLLVLYAFGDAAILCFNSRASLNYEYTKFLKVAFANVISNIVLSVLLILTCYQGHRYIGRAIGTAMPMFILGIIIAVGFFRMARPKDIRGYLSWGVRYSLPIVPHGLSQIILSQFDRIMINKLIGSLEAGVYSFGYNIYSIILVTYNSIDTVWAQWFYEKMHGNEKKTIKRISSIYMVLMLLFSSAVMLVSPELIVILGSKKYSDSIYCVLPIVAGGYFSFLYTIPCEVEYYHEKTKYIAAGTMLAALINIVTNYICILKFGYVAAAYTTLGTYMLYFLFHYFLAMKIQKENLFSNSIVLLCFVGIFISLFLSLLLINMSVIRWSLSIAMVGLMIGIEEKNIGILRNKKLL